MFSKNVTLGKNRGKDIFAFSCHAHYELWFLHVSWKYSNHHFLESSDWTIFCKNPVLHCQWRYSITSDNFLFCWFLFWSPWIIFFPFYFFLSHFYGVHCSVNGYYYVFFHLKKHPQGNTHLVFLEPSSGAWLWKKWAHDSNYLCQGFWARKSC